MSQFIYPNFPLANRPRYRRNRGGGIFNLREKQEPSDAYVISGHETWLDHASTRSFSISSSNVISSAADLAKLALDMYKGVGSTNKNFVLSADIDIGAYDWYPIGTGGHPFTSDFNGNGHTITGLYVNNDDSDYQGLFGCIQGNSARVRNLNLENVYVSTTGNYAGAVAGRAFTGTITYCNASGYVAGSASAGGICGQAEWEIENCSFSGHVDGIRYVGGIAGMGVYFNDCSADAIVTGETQVGGIVGHCYHNVTRCRQKGVVYGYGSEQSLGLIIGSFTNENNQLTVEKCIAEGEVIKINGGYAGAIVGMFDGINNTKAITECYARVSGSSVTSYYQSNFESSAVTVSGCYININNTKKYYSGGDFSGWSLVANFNNDLPVQNSLYSVAQGGFTSSQIKSRLQSKGYSYKAL